MAFNANEHLTRLQGKDYLEVKWRLVWFRDANKGGKIETELVSRTDTEAVFKATVTDDAGAVATAYGSETQKDFKDFTEKAETKAVGRALGYLGYGTQFAPEFDEGQRIVDSPVGKPEAKPEQKPQWKGNTISENQAKRMFAISKGNEALVRSVLTKYDYQHSKDVLRSDYDAICQEIEALAELGGVASV